MSCRLKGGLLEPHLWKHQELIAWRGAERGVSTRPIVLAAHVWSACFGCDAALRGPFDPMRKHAYFVYILFYNREAILARQ